MHLALCSLLAYLLLETALLCSDAYYANEALVLALAAWVVTLVGLARRGLSGRWLGPALWCVILIEASQSFLRAESLPLRVWPVVLLGLALVRKPLLAVACFAALGLWVIPGWQARERPNDWEIDVRYFQHAAAAELLAGRNPYSATYDNIYAPQTNFYGDKLLREGRVFSFPYPPLNLLVNVPGHLLGDVRWTHWFSIAGGACLLLLAGRRRGLAPGHPAELAIIALLLHPLTGLMVLRAWTEPLLFLAAGFCLWTFSGSSRLGRVLGLAALLSAKQYAVLAVPVFWLCGAVTFVEILAAGGVAFGLAVPFLVWDPVGFWWGNVTFHVENIFRPDALAVPAWLYQHNGTKLPTSVAFAAVLGVLVLVARFRRTSLAQGTLAFVAVLLAFFLFNKAAFLNYYWFTGMLLLAVVPLAAAESGNELAQQQRGDAYQGERGQKLPGEQAAG